MKNLTKLLKHIKHNHQQPLQLKTTTPLPDHLCQPFHDELSLTQNTFVGTKLATNHSKGLRIFFRCCEEFQRARSAVDNVKEVSQFSI